MSGLAVMAAPAKSTASRMSAQKSTQKIKRTRAGVGPAPPARDQRQAAFLEAYARLGTISAAARESGVGYRTHYDWLQLDDYRAKFAEAHESMVDHAEEELRNRGINGHDKPVYQGGELVGYVRERSDACLIFYLKGRRPDVFRDRFDATITQTMPISVYLPENSRALPAPAVDAEILPDLASATASAEPVTVAEPETPDIDVSLVDNGRDPCP